MRAISSRREYAEVGGADAGVPVLRDCAVVNALASSGVHWSCRALIIASERSPEYLLDGLRPV